MFSITPLINSLLLFTNALLVRGLDASLTLADVRQAFYEANIPQDANLTFNPSVFLEVIFPQESSSLSIVLYTPGTNLSVAAVALEPVFALVGPALSKDFVVIMVDLDVPSPSDPYLGPYRHFLGGDYVPLDFTPLGAFLLGNLTKPVSSWVSPAPDSVAPHRYVLLVYEQPTDFSGQTLITTNTSRYNWDMSAFVRAIGMGDPIGGTYMLVGA
ncbi:hypothetical protein IEO21_06651 [Rhodonia placenta]|uniref:PEBP-like protein n=1 Tax=Rhodonia placenta TaxID=104341 RepID=A0A8H7NZM5_9APHY|nr:hypothetical protein IEO21_06651 [Postia placenta]